MVKNTLRREDALTRERIIEEAIALLDSSGEGGLTFRALAERLATGAGALYWHIANKNDLLAAACDAIVARRLGAPPVDASPQDIIRAVALELFDAIDAHPWIGPALTRAPWQAPLVRILERLGQQIRALGIPQAEQFAAVSALLGYILGVSVQNAANAQTGKQLGGDRSAILGQLAGAWAQLDADAYPFTRSIAAQLREHDDRMDFLAGVDLILRGLQRG
ncbi:TetR family transcriptional regulator [Pseudoduganella sp. FT26W]|uniref:TetR family transcriptional regulator n=1 Tax=Duganella aquatilis TaxID=2666082 RepID=A0A844D8Q6_9BURK|nr:TetR family transcriptional regulator [Duganella aquatilis]MRW83629.1 TetR family transcriptional regulator [Duganella aquatilis]